MTSTATATATANRDRSYSASRANPVGSNVTIREDVSRNIPNGDFTVWTPVTVPAGTVVRVESYTNAGFRGIEVAFYFEGHYIHSVSAGVIA